MSKGVYKCISSKVGIKVDDINYRYEKVPSLTLDELKS